MPQNKKVRSELKRLANEGRPARKDAAQRPRRNSMAAVTAAVLREARRVSRATS